MKRLADDDLVHVISTAFGKMDDQGIDQVLNQGIGGVRACSIRFSPGIKKPARGGFDEGGWGYIKDGF